MQYNNVQLPEQRNVYWSYQITWLYKAWQSNVFRHGLND